MNPTPRGAEPFASKVAPAVPPPPASTLELVRQLQDRVAQIEHRIADIESELFHDPWE